MPCLIYLFIARLTSVDAFGAIQEVVPLSHCIAFHIPRFHHSVAVRLLPSDRKGLLLWGRTWKQEKSPEKLFLQQCKVKQQKRVVSSMIPATNLARMKSLCESIRQVGSPFGRVHKDLHAKRPFIIYFVSLSTILCVLLRGSHVDRISN